MAVLPRIHRMTQVNALNALLRDIQGVTFLDIDPYLEKDGDVNPQFTIDGNHLTDAGYELWADKLLATLSR